MRQNVEWWFRAVVTRIRQSFDGDLEFDVYLVPAESPRRESEGSD